MSSSIREHRILKAIMLAVFVTASANLGWQFYRMRLASLERQRLYEEYGGIVCYMGPDVDEVSRLLIMPCLLIALIGSSLRSRVFSKLLYVPGLLGAAILYAHWWTFYPRWASLPEARISHIAYLYEATYWDICIAVSVLLLLAWEVRGAALALFRPTTACSLTAR
jgi:hypothetical protein